jgi:hypothetical protein
MAHEPCGLVANIEHAVHLVRTNALFGRDEQEERRKPLSERDFRALKNGSDRHSELLTAIGALVDAGAMGFAIEKRNARSNGVPAVTADNAMRPNPCFEPVAGFGFVSKNRVLEVGGHG